MDSNINTLPQAVERPALRSGDLFGVNLEWHKGPAEGGTGTAGKDNGVDMWWDGDALLIVVGTNLDREIALVSVNADEDQLSLTCLNTGECYDAWSLSDVSWWAKLDDKTLPPRANTKAPSLPNTTVSNTGANTKT